MTKKLFILLIIVMFTVSTAYAAVDTVNERGSLINTGLGGVTRILPQSTDGVINNEDIAVFLGIFPIGAWSPLGGFLLFLHHHHH